MAENSKICGGCKKKLLNFLTSQKLALNSPAVSQLVKYSKIQTECVEHPCGLVLDQISGYQVLFKPSQMC